MAFIHQPKVSDLPPSMRSKDMSGCKFGRLTVLGYGDKKGRQHRWVCECQCGMYTLSFGFTLKNGTAQSCGCLTKERARDFWETPAGKNERLRRSRDSKIATHRKTKHPIYRVWSDMKARCLSERHKWFPHYGGRGITVCDEWMSFERFFEDMHNDWAKGLQLGRIDNDKGYSKDNCRWETASQQQRNKKTTIRVNTPDGIMALPDASDFYGLSCKCIKHRISAGWPIEKIFLTKSERAKK